MLAAAVKGDVSWRWMGMVVVVVEIAVAVAGLGLGLVLSARSVVVGVFVVRVGWGSTSSRRS